MHFWTMYWGRCQHADCWYKLAFTFMEWRLLELNFFNVLFLFLNSPHPHPRSVRIAWPLYIHITGSFASEAIVPLWIPHVCTLPLSTSIALSLSLSLYAFFCHFSTLLCVYTYVQCMCFHSIDNIAVSIAATIALCMTDKYRNLDTPPPPANARTMT